MLDLFVLLNSEADVYEKILCEKYNLTLIIEDESFKRYSGQCLKGHYYFDFDEELLNDFSKEELDIVPYSIYSVCHISYSSMDIIYDLLEFLIKYDDMLFVDDDHDNIVNIIKYEQMIYDEKVYPFAYKKEKFIVYKEEKHNDKTEIKKKK